MGGEVIGLQGSKLKLIVAALLTRENDGATTGFLIGERCVVAT